eukprot:scaffold90111_cov76-Phaeocystis_antarctica.AAC.5
MASCRRAGEFTATSRTTPLCITSRSSRRTRTSSEPLQRNSSLLYHLFSYGGDRSQEGRVKDVVKEGHTSGHKRFHRGSLPTEVP